MLKPAIQSSTLPLLQQLARFNERRQEVLSGNIAKIDTPGYKTRDLPVEAFQEAMSKAIDRLKSPSASTSPFTSALSPLTLPTFAATEQPMPADSIEALFTSELFQAKSASPANITFQDGGNRSIEREVMEMTKTLMLQNYALQLMNSQYSMLETVISERA